MRRGVVGVIVLLCGGMSSAQPSPTPMEAPSLRITSRAPLPSELNRAKDVRWASDGSVYLALAGDGASEVSLDPAGQKIREMVPGRAKPGGFFVSHQVAVSSQYFLVSANALGFTWRRMDAPTRSDEAAETIQGVDLWNDRLVLVGARRDEKGRFAPDGAIAWIGSLGQKLADLRPLAYASSGPGAREMAACGTVRLGGVRFFEDGSFVILPGVQPGLSFYDRDGKLLRTVDTITLGIDSDCGSLSQEESARIAVDYAARMAWVNRRRTVDTVLNLPKGPGLVVRSVENGRVQWRLDVIGSEGTVERYSIPIEAPDEFFHLRGDVRSGKIVFLLYQTPPSDKNHAQPHLLTASVPKDEKTRPESGGER